MIYIRKQLSLKNYIVFDGTYLRNVVYQLDDNNDLIIEESDGIYKITYGNIHVMTNGVHSYNVYEKLLKYISKAKILGIRYTSDEVLDYIRSLRDKGKTHCKEISNMPISHYVLIYDKSESIPNYNKDMINLKTLMALASSDSLKDCNFYFTGDSRDSIVYWESFLNNLVVVSREFDYDYKKDVNWSRYNCVLRVTFDNEYIKLYRFFDTYKLCICVKYPLSGDFNPNNIMQLFEIEKFENCSLTSFDFGNDICIPYFGQTV